MYCLLPNAIRQFGDKATAKETMRRAGLSPIPGSEGVVPTLEGNVPPSPWMDTPS